MVSGQSYADFVHERLLHPLGMLDTTMFPSREQLQRLAKSYASGERMREEPIVQLTPPFDDSSLRAVSPSGGWFRHGAGFWPVWTDGAARGRAGRTVIPVAGVGGGDGEQGDGHTASPVLTRMM